MFNDIYLLTVDIDEKNKKFTAVWKKEVPVDPKNLPPRRTAHSCCVLRNRYIVVIGGEGREEDLKGRESTAKSNKPLSNLIEIPNNDEDEEESYCYVLNDVWIYDIMKKTWHEIKAKNSSKFLNRFGHSCCSFNDKVYVFGGNNFHLIQRDPGQRDALERFKHSQLF